MPGREQAERVAEMKRVAYPRRFDEVHQDTERERAMHTPESEIDDNSIAVQAAKEVDSQRREIDEEIVERMKERQRYFYEKAQMHREAADHYTRMSEDISELLNNDYVNGPQKTAMT